MEADLKQRDDAVAHASSNGKRMAEDDESWRVAEQEWRQSRRRRSAWLRDRDVEWWDKQAQRVQDASDQGDPLGCLPVEVDGKPLWPDDPNNLKNASLERHKT